MPYSSVLFLVLLIVPFSQLRASPGNPDNWCRSGSFANEGPEFQVGTVSGEKDSRIHFLGDSGNCPTEGGKKCQEKAYLIPGDEVIVARGYKGYLCSSFLSRDKKGHVQETVGWLPGGDVKVRSVDDKLKSEDWEGKWSDGYQSIDIAFVATKKALRVKGAAQWDGGNGNVHVGEANALATPVGNRMTVMDGDCQLKLTLVGRYLLASDNAECGGVNVRFDGVYLK